MNRIAWRVYECPDGCGQSFCGEFDRKDLAEEHAMKDPGGLPDWKWDTARLAGHCWGMRAPDESGIEDEEAVFWWGNRGQFCVVKVRYESE